MSKAVDFTIPKQLEESGVRLAVLNKNSWNNFGGKTDPSENALI